MAANSPQNMKKVRKALSTKLFQVYLGVSLTKIPLSSEKDITNSVLRGRFFYGLKDLNQKFSTCGL